jgi:alpha-amylase
MLLARRYYAYGPEELYLDRRDCIGFTRRGHRGHSENAGLAVLLTSADEAMTNTMRVGAEHAGERWTDILGNADGEVVIDPLGWATFSVGPRSVSVWADSDAVGREGMEGFVL